MGEVRLERTGGVVQIILADGWPGALFQTKWEAGIVIKAGVASGSFDSKTAERLMEEVGAMDIPDR